MLCQCFLVTCFQFIGKHALTPGVTFNQYSHTSPSEPCTGLTLLIGIKVRSEEGKEKKWMKEEEENEEKERDEEVEKEEKDWKKRRWRRPEGGGGWDRRRRRATISSCPLSGQFQKPNPRK